jgi:hypothetical protein
MRSSPISIAHANMAAPLHVPISNKRRAKHDHDRVAIPLHGVAEKNSAVVVNPATSYTTLSLLGSALEVALGAPRLFLGPIEGR